MSNPYPGYGQQPPQGYGGFGQAPGQAPYPGPGHMPTGQAAPLPPPGAASSGRRGTSRALPIMVAAGLAVGVCGGLVLVLGTGESDAASKKPVVPAVSDETKDKGTSGDEQVAVVTPDAAVPPPPPDAAPEPRTRKVTIRFDVEPAEAEVSVDGKAITDGTYTIELEREETRTVAIEAKASGYKTFKSEHTIAGNDEIPVKLEKRSSRTGGSRRNDNRSTNPGRDTGGRIDL
jgi:hypothetical protein